MNIQRWISMIWLSFLCLAFAGMQSRAQTADVNPAPAGEEVPPGPVPDDVLDGDAPPPPPSAADEPDEDDDVFVVPYEDDIAPEVVMDDAVDGRISVNLDEVPLQDVVRMFTRISDANIIASGTNLQEKVTVNLHNVDWKTGLESILDLHDLTLRERTPGSGVYTIAHQPPDALEPLTVEPIFLKYANVQSAQSIVEGMIDPRGVVTPYPSGNALVVRTTQANLTEIKEVIESIDLPRQQVFIEAKFLELNDEAIKALGINWQVLDAYSVGAGNLVWSVNELRQWERIRDDESVMSDERSQTDSLSQSFDEGALDSSTRTVQDSVQRTRDRRSDHSDTFDRSIEDMRSAVLSASDLSVILSALEGMEGVSIVSNPKIIVANEETATIHIGEKERPFISQAIPQRDGLPTVVTYNPGEEVDFGIKLDVTPTINTDSNITVRIAPELTRFVRDAVAPDGQTYPIVSTKTIQTIFSLEDGKTAAIGGLTETTERDRTNKIPLLGDIPLLGKFFFSHERREKMQQETIIFVTVGLANPHTMLPNEGLPEDAELIFRHQQQQQMRRRQRELEQSAR